MTEQDGYTYILFEVKPRSKFDEVIYVGPDLLVALRIRIRIDQGEIIRCRGVETWNLSFHHLVVDGERVGAWRWARRPETDEWLTVAMAKIEECPDEVAKHGGQKDASAMGKLWRWLVRVANLAR